MQYYFSFDVESVGLYGMPFAYGWCVVDETGVEHARELRWFRDEYLDPELTGTDIYEGVVQTIDGTFAVSKNDVDWVRANVLPHLPDESAVESTHELLYLFWEEWISCKDQFKPLYMVTDCPFPVETRFLHEVMRQNTYGQVHDLMSLSPYPIIDVASVLLAHGKDPMATYERKASEQPAHNPLCDARQSVRLMLEAMKL